MTITAREFQGLAKGKMKNKMQTKAPTVKAPRIDKKSKALLVPYQSPSQRMRLS